jgi:hypothetical protein
MAARLSSGCPREPRQLLAEIAGYLAVVAKLFSMSRLNHS